MCLREVGLQLGFRTDPSSSWNLNILSPTWQAAGSLQMRADTIPLASISQETNNVLIFITNVYNCSQMLCKFRTKHLLTQNTPHFLSFRNTLSIKVLQKNIQIQTKDNNKRPCHLHQVTWQSAWGYNAIWCKQRCVLRQVTTYDERNCPPRTPKWNNSLCFPASFSLFGAATKC